MKQINRSAKTGKFVTKKAATKHPATTVTEKVYHKAAVASDIVKAIELLTAALKKLK